MDDLILRAAAIEYLMTNMGWHDEDGYPVDDSDEKRAIITDLVNGIPAVDAAPVVMAGAELTDAELIEKIRKAPIVLKPNVDAIPVEWMRDKMRGYASALKSTETAALVMVMQMWEKEQEART